MPGSSISPADADELSFVARGPDQPGRYRLELYLLTSDRTNAVEHAIRSVRIASLPIELVAFERLAVGKIALLLPPPRSVWASGSGFRWRSTTSAPSAGASWELPKYRWCWIALAGAQPANCPTTLPRRDPGPVRDGEGARYCRRACGCTELGYRARTLRYGGPIRSRGVFHSRPRWCIGRRNFRRDAGFCPRTLRIRSGRADVCILAQAIRDCARKRN